MEEEWQDGVWWLNFSQYEDLRLYEVGRQKCPAGYEFGPIIRDKYILHYVFNGAGMLYLDQKEFAVKEQSLFLMPPNTLVRYQADPERPWHYIWIHIHGFKVVELLQKAGLTRKTPVLWLPEAGEQLGGLLQEICSCHEQEYACMGKLYNFFQLLIDHSPDKPEEGEQTEPALRYVQWVIDYINQKYSEPICVQSIADFCGIDRSYLSKVFKYATGYTIQEYLIRFRMKKAKQLLSETAMPVQHVSYSVGYNDPFSFSKVFKKQTGMSPSVWRNAGGNKI